MTRRIARDDDEVFDDAIYDRRYFPRRVYKDGCGPRVRLMLTDSSPPPRAVFDASAHRPRYAVVDRADPHVMAAERAYADHNAYLRDAWKTMGGGTGGAAHTTAPPADEQDGESPRDAYVRRISSAWKTGNGNSHSADNIAALTRSWLSPGARPGPGPGYSDARPAVSRETATKDAAADREQAYAGYLDRLTNGWRK
jgi:hypothetical protein